MRSRNIAALSAAFFISTVVAAENPEKLAIESYRHLVSAESLLDGAVRSGDRRDYIRFIWAPTTALIDRWPSPSTPGLDKHHRCHFALLSFRTWSDDHFSARGRLPGSSPSAKDYFDQRRLCRESLKGRV